MHREYVQEFGASNCCYIPREAGDEISLLTELVYTSQVMDLFPKKTRPET